MVFIKYSDETVIVDTTNSAQQLQSVVDDFSLWCRDNHPTLNIPKTNGRVINTRCSSTSPPALQVDGQIIERLGEYQCLGSIIDHKFTFRSKTDRISKKCQQHLDFLRRLRRLQVDVSILQSLYNCFLKPTLTFSILAWLGSLREVNKCPLNGIMKMSGKIIGQPQTTLTAMHEKQAIRKTRRIMSDPTHNLINQYHLLPSGRRLRSLPLRTKPAMSTFGPASIRLVNKQ